MCLFESPVWGALIRLWSMCSSYKMGLYKMGSSEFWTWLDDNIWASVQMWFVLRWTRWLCWFHPSFLETLWSTTCYPTSSSVSSSLFAPSSDAYWPSPSRRSSLIIYCMTEEKCQWWGIVISERLLPVSKQTLNEVNAKTYKYKHAFFVLLLIFFCGREKRAEKM